MKLIKETLIFVANSFPCRYRSSAKMELQYTGKTTVVTFEEPKSENFMKIFQCFLQLFWYNVLESTFSSVTVAGELPKCALDNLLSLRDFKLFSQREEKLEARSLTLLMREMNEELQHAFRFDPDNLELTKTFKTFEEHRVHRREQMRIALVERKYPVWF